MKITRRVRSCFHSGAVVAAADIDKAELVNPVDVTSDGKTASNEAGGL